MGLNYFSDEELIHNLRLQFPREEQYMINFKQALNSARFTSEGIVITVEKRKFLIHTILGVVIRELWYDIQ